MLVNYMVNYGVSYGSGKHLNQTESFNLYRDAKSFYDGLDREKWGAANLVKLIPEGLYVTPLVKHEYITRR